jgi:ubiquinone/menaquinone biosynthesis C-methylase UbiE
VSRYDGLADWYDGQQAIVSTRPDAPWPMLIELAGAPKGVLLDIGCGTGVSSAVLADGGWTVVGVDLSADQLRLARARGIVVARSDAVQVPVADAGVDAITLAFVHTDVVDFAAVIAEAARALRPGGRLVHLGIHPCFVGHHVDTPSRDKNRRTIHAGYDNTEHIDSSPQFGAGIRSRVGMRHVPLASLLQAFLDAPLDVERVVEHGDGLVPWVLAVSARRCLE